MIHAYNKMYLEQVTYTVASIFDIAVNSVGLKLEEFLNMFIETDLCHMLEKADLMIIGKSSVEILEEFLNKKIKVKYDFSKRSREFWFGYVLSYTSWYLNKTYKEILTVIPCDELIMLYNTLHEADIKKTIDLIDSRFNHESKIKLMRIKRGLSQSQLARISDVKLRTIKSYEQRENDINKANVLNLRKLSQALNCNLEDLLD